MGNRKAQTILEYAVVAAVVVAALLAMQSYIKRAIQGKYREAADVFGGGEQYEYEVTQVE
jgi:Flp pilus assembly pilin Flp